MTEARYRGQKVVAVAPDYADNVKFADEWLPAKPGTDAALAMAMGHVVLKEFFVDRQTPYFTHYVKSYTDLPHLVRLEEAGDGEYTSGKFLTAADLAEHAHEENAAFKTVLIDAATGVPVVPNGSIGHRYGDAGIGHWNLELGDVEPLLSLLDTAEESVVVRMPRFDTPDGAAADLPRGVPTRRIGGHLVTTVFDLLLAQYGVGRFVDGQRLPGEWAEGYDDAGSPYTPAWQETITGGPASTAARIGRLPHPHQPHRLPGCERRRLGPLRRPGEGQADHRLHPDRQRLGLEPATAQHDPDRLLVPPHQPVPLRPVRRRHPRRHYRSRSAGRQVHR
jgi:nitrate reductase alpha subunit